MRFVIQTKIKDSHHKEVFSLFDEKLFSALAPPFPPFKLQRFDGCKTGDEVHIVLGAGSFKQLWHSLIIDNQESSKESYFVDEGKILPFFLKTWLHKHIIKQEGKDVIIVDDIQLSWTSPLWKVLIYPGLYLSFLYRKPVYKSYFSKALHKSRR
jgi:ligand-binding SRPBCC domain-containing protein